MNDPTDNHPAPLAPQSFADQVGGRQPRAIDRDLSTLLQDNYVVTDLRHGIPGTGPTLPGTWTRMSDDELRAADIAPALQHDARSGFDASFYRNAQGQVVLAFTGTDEGKDWLHNFGQGLGLRDEQYDQAIKLGERAKRAFGDGVVFTGHSLGGGLAAASGMVNEVPAVTFNAAGVHDRTLERYGYDADILKRQAEQGLIRSYAVKNELLTYLQEENIPLRYAMPDAPGHRIELPDPDPQTFFERLVPGRMLRHRLDLHYIDAVMQAQDKAGPLAQAADRASNRLLGDALGALSPQRGPLGLDDDERFLNTAARLAARAGQDGLRRIDHLVPSPGGERLFAVQGELHDPGHLRSHVGLAEAGRIPASQSAQQLRQHELATLAEAMPEPARAQQRPMTA